MCRNRRNVVPCQDHECVLYRHERQSLGDGMYTNMVTTIIGRKSYNQGSPPIYNTRMPESSYNEPRYSYHLTLLLNLSHLQG